MLWMWQWSDWGAGEWRWENQTETSDIFVSDELHATVASGNSEGMMISSLAMVLAA